MVHVDFKMILNKMICLVNERTLPNIYEDVISEISGNDDLKSNQAIILSKFKSKKLERMKKLISLVLLEYKDKNNFIEIYDLLDLFEFILTITKSFDLKFNDDQIVNHCLKFKQISKFIEEVAQWVKSSDKQELLKDLLLTEPKLGNIECWIKIEAYNFISSIYKEIESLDIYDLNFNPYLLMLFNFKTLEEAIILPYEQTISRKMSGKWGLVGENILRHNYAVRSELREFDLQKYVFDEENDKYVLHHYEIKSMPAGTMRGAEEKKFFEKVIPDYQRNFRYSEVGFMLGGLYQSKRAPSLDNKVKRMIDQNSDVQFIAFPRVVIGGQELWLEFTEDADFFNKLQYHFNQVAEVSVLSGRGSILYLIDKKKKELLKELKIVYSNINSIVSENL